MCVARVDGEGGEGDTNKAASFANVSESFWGGILLQSSELSK